MTGIVAFAGRQRHAARDLHLIQADGGGNDDDMPPGLSVRVDRLEKDAAEIKGDVKTLSRDVRNLSGDVAKIEGRVSMLPSTFQMRTWFVGVAIALVGMVFAIARLTK